MRCPSCDATESKVVDSRAADDGSSTRRRRECTACSRRFTTFERIEELPLTLVKRSGDRVPFDRANIVSGLVASAKGRPLAEADFECIASEIEEEARLIGPELSSEWVGLAVLDKLRAVDPVAALRFASVYKGFSDVADFEREMRLIKRS